MTYVAAFMICYVLCLLMYSLSFLLLGLRLQLEFSKPPTGFVGFCLAGCALLFPEYRAKLTADAYGERHVTFWDAHRASGTLIKRPLSVLPVIGRVFASKETSIHKLIAPLNSPSTSEMRHTTMKIVRYVLLGLLAISSPHVVQSLPTDRNTAELERISQIYADGNLETALEEIDDYLATYSHDDLAWTIKGNILEAQERDEAAKEAYKHALSLNPDNFQATSALGIIYRKEGDYETAMEWYKKALELNPGYAQAYSSMAVIELKRNHDAQALEYAKRGYECDQEDPVVAANLAVTYHYNEMIEERDIYTAIAEKLGYRNMETLYQIYRGELTVKDQ